jgi:hypothetical protein
MNYLREHFKNFEIKSIEDTYLVFKTINSAVATSQFNYRLYFRGERDYEWDIESSLKRKLSSKNSTEYIELQKTALLKFEKKLNKFKCNHVFRNIFNHLKFGHDWDTLCQAQHAGVNTTLIDITQDYLTALYFATEVSGDSETEDAKLWCMIFPAEMVMPHKPEEESFFGKDPFNLETDLVIHNPIYWDDLDKRCFEKCMHNQKGAFFASSPLFYNTTLNNREEYKDFIFKIKIPAQYKESIRVELRKLGICSKTIYTEGRNKLKFISDNINREVYSI